VLHTLEFACPRCQQASMAEFYGPCATCVVELRAGQVLSKQDAVLQDYIPKMNVTPNAVASKE
jgi:hypothetical protein